MKAIFVVALVGIFIFGCVSPPPGGNTTMPPGYENPQYCKTASDCVRQQSCCDCGLGQYVNKYNYNSTACTGPVCKCALQPSHGDCEGNKCVGVADSPPTPPPPPPPPENNTTTVPPGYEAKDYCKANSDCVRLNKCCDCGEGEYVNKYNQVEVICGEPRCMCPIALSHGECHSNKCVAVTGSAEPPPEENIVFSGSHGECGSQIMPIRLDTSTGMKLSGSISAPNPCYKVVGTVSKTDSLWKLMLTTEKAPSGTDYCPTCSGTIAWTADISGYSGTVEVYYNGKKVFPDKAGFCGWATNATCNTNSDCMTGGCSGQGKGEEPVITTCEYSECYNAAAFGVGCGCVAGKCQWG